MGHVNINIIKKITAALSLLTLSISASAAETINVATSEWENYTNKDETGYYFDVIRKVFPTPQWQVNFTIVPFKRSVTMLSNGKADITLGVYDGDLIKGQYSKHILEQDLVDAAVSEAIATSWAGIESLAGKEVVASIGYGFDAISPVKMNYKEKASLDGMLKMLVGGRVDAVLDYELDIVKAEQEHNITPNYVIKKAVLSSPIFFGFSESDKGILLKKHFDEQIQKLIDSGKLKQMMQHSLGSSDSFPYP
jgi:polar amino acid transport system substrate-binding protein